MDEHLLFLLNQKWVHPVLDRFLGTLSCLAFWIPFLVCIAVWLMWKRGLRGQTFVALCVLGISINETLISQPLKTWTQKPRPHEVLAEVRRVDLAPARPRLLALAKPLNVTFSGPPPVHHAEGGRRSFPSAHVLNATTLSLLLTLCWGMRGWLLLAPLMAWSRVYTGAHWPSDVAASLLLGTCCTLFYLWTFEQLWQRWILRLRPAWAQVLPQLVLPLGRRSHQPRL